MAAANPLVSIVDQKEFIGFVHEKLDDTYYTPDIPELFKQEEQYVFVYGTLKNGFCRHTVLKDSGRLIGEGYTLDEDFIMYRMAKQYGFPIGMRTEFSSINGHLQGEVFLVRTKKLVELDFIESNGTMYYREQIPIVVTTADTKKRATVNAWTFLGIPSYWKPKFIGEVKICDLLRKNKDPQFKYYTFQRKWDLSSRNGLLQG